jgi:hypothetical protein
MWALTLIGLAGCPHPARTAPDAPLPDRPADHVYQDTPDSGLLFVWKVGDGYEVASVARGTATSVELDATSAEQVVTVDLRDGRRLPAVRDTSPWTQSVARWMGKALDAPVSVTGTPSEPDPVPPEVVSVPGAEQSTLDKGRINETITGALQQVRDCYRARPARRGAARGLRFHSVRDRTGRSRALEPRRVGHAPPRAGHGLHPRRDRRTRLRCTPWRRCRDRDLPLRFRSWRGSCRRVELSSVAPQAQAKGRGLGGERVVRGLLGGRASGRPQERGLTGSTRLDSCYPPARATGSRRCSRTMSEALILPAPSGTASTRTATAPTRPSRRARAIRPASTFASPSAPA